MSNEALLVGLAFGAVLVLLSRALIKTRRQGKLMKLQSEEIKRHVAQLEERNQALERANQEKLQLISLVSHDLKGPFNRIFALIQLVSMGDENLTEEQRDYLGKIHQISADGLSMVRNLLDSHRFESRGIELVPAATDLMQVVALLVKNYTTIASKKKIEVSFRVGNPVLLMVDKLYLSRAIENLLSNAIKFSPDFASVTVSLVVDHGIVLSVHDSGPGISAEDQLKLFQPFHRLSARPTGGESSTGLGLYIVKTIIDKMGGSVQCVSEPGKGTTFSLVLPEQLLIK